MERHDQSDEARDAAAERLQHKHPAAPQGSHFAEGIEHKPKTPEEEVEPDFARGVRQGPDEELEHQGRFSEGIEEAPDTPDKTVERRFSEGVERSPTSE
jgi:hypothetical protein